MLKNVALFIIGNLAISTIIANVSSAQQHLALTQETQTQEVSQTESRLALKAHLIPTFRHVLWEQDSTTFTPKYLLTFQLNGRNNNFVRSGTSKISANKDKLQAEYKTLLSRTQSYLEQNYGKLVELHFSAEQAFLHSTTELDAKLQEHGTSRSEIQSVSSATWPGEKNLSRSSQKGNVLPTNGWISSDLPLAPLLKNFPAEPSQIEIHKLLSNISTHPSFGSKNPMVSLYIFQDLACGMSSRLYHTAFKKILAEFSDQVRVTFVESPLGSRPHEVKLARAAKCADRHGKYKDYLDATFVRREKGYDKDHVLDDVIDSLQVNTDSFRSCMEDLDSKLLVEQDVAIAQKLGVNGSPYIFINGELVKGAKPFETFKHRIEKYLSVVDEAAVVLNSVETPQLPSL